MVLKKLIEEFPQKGWCLRSLNYLLKKLRETSTTDRQPGSGRPRTSYTAENIEQLIIWCSVRRVHQGHTNSDGQLVN